MSFKKTLFWTTPSASVASFLAQELSVEITIVDMSKME